MIDFEEELKKYQLIPGVDKIEEVIYENDKTDMTDLIKQMMKEYKTNEV